MDPPGQLCQYRSRGNILSFKVISIDVNYWRRTQTIIRMLSCAIVHIDMIIYLFSKGGDNCDLDEIYSRTQYDTYVILAHLCNGVVIKI